MPTSTAALTTVAGEPSWRLASRDIELFVTCSGGQVAPVTFDRRGRKIQPYSIAPWATDATTTTGLPPILRALRGDFFCLPFGGNSTKFRGEVHPLHGESANRDWTLQSLAKTRAESTLHLSLRTRIRPGKIDKTLTLIDGHPVVYSRHLISEMSGPMNLGHHAMLKFPAEEASGLISTSRFVWGSVNPEEFEKPAEGGYSCLKPGAKFLDLCSVPRVNGAVADLSRYPARRGYEDLVMMVADPSLPLAWTAVTFPRQRYVWWALRDPQILKQTIFWISNAGRHFAPWNGRHHSVMGIEDVTSYFADGLSESAKANPLSREGFATTLRLNPRKPVTVNYICGCMATPPGFDRVKSIVPNRSQDAILLTSESGKTVAAPMHVPFLFVRATPENEGDVSRRR